MKLVFATNNAHKLQEARSILAPFIDSGELELLSLSDIAFSGDIDETEPTLEGNSRLKARTINQQTGYDCFADDTGLEVEALGGAPGVLTARYAGEGHDDKANRKLLLDNLQNIENRKAQFRCVVTLIIGGKEQQFEGIVRGTIANKESGEGGFGYDPIFIPEGYTETFAELPAATKNSMSHRGRALKQMAQSLV